MKYETCAFKKFSGKSKHTYKERKLPTQTKLIAFHGQQSIKDKFVKRVQTHQEFDEVVQGTYWKGGKGCAVGCTIHGREHAKYEKVLGVSVILARLEDRIFEGLSNENAKTFPAEFIAAIPVGADLSNVWPQFATFLMIDEQHGVLRFAHTDEVKECINEVARLYLDGVTDREIWLKLYRKTNSARNNAWEIRRKSHAYAATVAADAATAYAADAASAAADAASATADAADAAAAARLKARQDHFQIQRIKLIELLKNAPIAKVEATV